MKNLLLKLFQFCGVRCGRHVHSVIVLGQNGSKFRVVSADVMSDDELVVTVIGNDSTVGMVVEPVEDAFKLHHNCPAFLRAQDA